MKEKISNEWFLDTKFGKVAMISWGESSQPKVLLIHGYQDSAATFLPLMVLLPDTHYYVGFDFPGHGKSDPVSSMQLFSQAFIPQLMREIVNHLGWNSFVCLSHSIGFVIAIVYHHVYPGRVRRMINIDPVFALTGHSVMIDDPINYYHWVYGTYFGKLLDKKNIKRPYEEFVQEMMQNRHMSRDQAEVTLSRSLVPVGDGLFRLSTQPMMKRLLIIPTYEETLHYILSHNIPPTLNFHGMKMGSMLHPKKLDFGLRFMKFDNPGQKDVFVDAHHDMHITHAEELVPHIVAFLKQDFEAKL